MLHTLRRIVQAVSAASGLDEAARTIVRRVKETMGVDACSIFLADRHAGQYLLIATDGLAPDAVGRARIAKGEGLVGFVGDQQKPLNVARAPDHRSYRFIPQTGEERFRAFLGVPIIHQGQVVGGLVRAGR